MRRKLKVGPLWAGFIAFSVLLAYAVPEGLYSSSAAAKAFADGIASVARSIDQLAAVSDFPGTTRIVLATLTLCVPPLFLFQWLVPGYVGLAPQRPLTPVLRWGGAVLLLSMIVMLPVALQIQPEDLQPGGSRMGFALRLMSHSRFALGFIAGAFTVCSAWLLALIPLLIRGKVNSDS